MTLSKPTEVESPVAPEAASASHEAALYSSSPQSSLVLGAESSPIILPHTHCTIRPQVRLARYTSYRVGGPAEWFVMPRTANELAESIAWANKHSIPVMFLGAGSNLLISDRGLPGLIICTRQLRHSSFDPATAQVTIAAGEPLPNLAWKAADLGWSGFEWAVGIPGTVGGAVVMNAGAHRACIADILLNTQVITRTGGEATLDATDLNYRYRTSNLQGDLSRFVVQATFQLQPGYEPAAIAKKTRHHQTHRHRTQPYHLPSCGSVFRNPNPYAAGWLIEQSGLKGFQIGDAQVAERHANFILNCGKATSNDILRLIRHVQEEVEHRWQQWLEPEVKIMGEFEIA